MLSDLPKIPTLDWADFAEGDTDQRLKLAQGLVQGFKRFGFVKLVNHGLSDELIQQLFAEVSRHSLLVKRFYRLPDELKQKAAHPPGPNPQRGWSGIGVESTSKLYGEQTERPSGKLKDAKVGTDFSSSKSSRELTHMKEHYDIGPPTDTQFPTRWPDEQDIPGWRAFMESYYARGQSFCLDLMEALEIGLELPKNTLRSMCIPDGSELRLLHYPEIPAAELRTGDTARIWPHTDFGLITLLFQDGVGGLEVEDPLQQGHYIEVAREQPYEMIVNVSATFERWMNGVIKAAVHRVNITPEGKHVEDAVVPERWSAAYFFKAHKMAHAGPLPAFVTPERPALYDDITALEFQKRRTDLVYTGQQLKVEEAA
ncbi:unnamed protein product [Aspergillus oryzae RIB40]|uniref:DNA, SC001 n=1 Tax=Aspergillus oryzae (strain ATCC 42149 / RIB 40) TaxID=510516 RepID=Q2UPD9_ASPOR|nr:unnamed protein product [Aspergillus oryzae RIB40]BAE56576.1 unnamed protein product [Aspergillus oryzae RIB40]